MVKTNTSNKNSKKTMNVRTHNPFDTYLKLDKDASNRNNNNPNDNLNEEFAAEFDSKAKNKNNATNHAKDQKSNKN
ncbi:hypothetical protein ACWV26_16450 [Rummeliibacillus sp. JY-2-4R]